MWLLLIFLVVPIVEIALFIQVGGWIGLWPTLALVLAMAVGGTALIRLQGLQTLRRLRASIEGGADPTGPIAHGALILVAGMLMITPGFFTDALGLVLLVPVVREQVIRWGAAKMAVRAAGSVRAGTRPTARRGETIETDYEVVEDAAPPRPGRSGWTRQP